MTHVDYLSRHPVSQVTFAPFEKVIPDTYNWQSTITIVEGRKSEAITISERTLKEKPYLYMKDRRLSQKSGGNHQTLGRVNHSQIKYDGKNQKWLSKTTRSVITPKFLEFEQNQCTLSSL